MTGDTSISGKHQLTVSLETTDRQEAVHRLLNLLDQPEVSDWVMKKGWYLDTDSGREADQ